jgi:biopolymer transport protein ExbD
MIRIPDSDREGILGDWLPDLTPLLDVMFMLIVFLILTANAVPFAVDVALPSDEQAVSRAVEEDKTLTLTLLPEGEGWQLNQQNYFDETAMQQALLAEYRKHKEQRIIIAGEKSVSMQKLLNAITFLRKHQIQTADILVKQP